MDKLPKFTFIILALMSSLLCSAAAEEITIGVPPFSRDINLISDTHPLTFIVRSALGRTLVAPQQYSEHEVRLDLADLIKISPEGRFLRLRIINGVSFQDGTDIRAKDVTNSLQQCKSLSNSTQIDYIKADSLRNPLDRYEEWVEIGLKQRLSEDSFHGLLGQLRECPVYSSQMAHLFAEDFGKGSNIVGSGPYQVAGYKLGSSYSLALVKWQSSNSNAPAKVNVRSFSDAEHGLTALRMGTIDLLFAEDAAILEKGDRDETIEMKHCGGYSLLKRRSLSFACSSVLQLTNLRYIR